MARTAKSSSLLIPALAHAWWRFFAWWSGELAAVVPARLRLWWRGSDRMVLLLFNGARAVFERPAGTRREEICAVELDSADPALHRTETGRRLVQAAGRNFRLLLCIAPEQVLRRTVALPLAVEENLRQTLAFELDRYTPFRADQVYFDFRVIERDAAQKRLAVDLAAVPKSVVDQGVARATALGLVVDGAVLAEEVLQRGADCLNFLPSVGKKHSASARTWWRVGTAALAAVLLAVLLAVPLWQKRAAAIALLEPLAKSKAAAQETDALRDRLRKLVEEHNFLHNKKWESYSTVEVLSELSKLLPDDTFLMQLDFDGKSVQIQGDTGSSTSLVETLEASPLLKDVGFKAQLTKLQGTPYDRFNISATLERAAMLKPAAANPDARAAAPGPAGLPGPPAASAPAASAKPADKP